MNKYIVWEKERDSISGVGKALTEMAAIERKPRQKPGGLQAEAGSIKDGSLPLLSNLCTCGELWEDCGWSRGNK